MHEYIKEHILEELEGATDYWTKAVDYKNSRIGETFKNMAEAELEHANSLLEIFNTLEPYNDYIEDRMYKDILNAYGKAMYKIAQLERLYKKED